MINNGYIARNPEAAKEDFYDAIIIGGGIYGVMITLIASQNKLKTLLLERDDYGASTSFNSLRIIHGGFRYLQHMDLLKFSESVIDRRWFFQNFPELIKPTACLMPLYGNGIYRLSVFKISLLLNDILSVRRNKNVLENVKLPRGKIISPEEVKRIFSNVDDQKLKGGAVWYDGSMEDSQRVLIESLKWACSLGATALNYFEVKKLNIRNNKAEGVEAYDKESGKNFNFNSRFVINAAGPWCSELAESFDKKYPNLFKSSLAWNVLFDKESLSQYALAVTPKRKGAKTYFLRSLNGKIFAGTVHEPWNGIVKNPQPSKDSIQNFIYDLNSTIKNINLRKEDILHIYSGHMPVTKEGTDKLMTHEIIVDHSKEKGPKGFYSISGVKFTTARIVAEKVIRSIFPDYRKTNTKREINTELKYFSFDWSPNKIDDITIEYLKKIIESESVQHLDDLILRRTSIGDSPNRALKIADKICTIFNWDNERCKNETNRLKEFYHFAGSSQIIYSNPILN